MVLESTYTKLQSILNKFALQEIYDVLHKFRNISWQQLQDRIVRNKYSVIKKNVIQVIVQIVKETETSDEELEQLSSTLLLIRTSKSKNKNWVTYCCKDKSEHEVYIENIFESISKSIKRQGILADITTEKIDSRHAVSITKKIIVKSKGLRKMSPIYFQFYAGYPYLFCSRKITEAKLLLAVVEGLGYNKCKLANLIGKNVFELLKMLQNRQGNVNSASMLLSKPVYQPVLSKNEHGVNFEQRNTRTKLADHLYGPSPPEIQTLSVTIKDAIWQSNEYGMRGEPLQGVKLTLRSPNAIELIKELISEDIVTMPVPQYMQAILNSGKNHMKLVQNKIQHMEIE